jgi:hypothetical protein
MLSEGAEVVQMMVVVSFESKLAEHEEMATAPGEVKRERQRERLYQAMSEAFFELSPAKERPFETWRRWLTTRERDRRPRPGDPLTWIWDTELWQWQRLERWGEGMGGEERHQDQASKGWYETSSPGQASDRERSREHLDRPGERGEEDERGTGAGRREGGREREIEGGLALRMMCIFVVIMDWNLKKSLWW